MAFPKRLLAEGEELVLDIRPHWVALVLPTLAAVLLIVAEVLVLTNLPRSWPDWVGWAAGGAGVILFLAFPLRAFLAWVTSHFVVTSDRLIHRSGWLAKQAMEIPLERVNDVRFRQSVLERVVGAGDLVIESGGEFGQNHFSDIRKPEDVQKLIFEMSEQNQARMSAGRPASVASDQGGPEDEDESPLDQVERLAALRERGLISEEEFETQKRRLLGRL
jgi:uncharacterized membrane protein YdbT with pleckstrin-like domain